MTRKLAQAMYMVPRFQKAAATGDSNPQKEGKSGDDFRAMSGIRDGWGSCLKSSRSRCAGTGIGRQGQGRQASR